MTLCLSAIACSGDSIVSIFDEQLTASASKADTLVKGVRISDRWVLFFAGDDIRHVGVIIDEVKNLLLHRRGVTVAQAQAAIVQTRDRIRNACVDVEVLGTVGISREAFLRNGRLLIGDPDLYKNLLDKVVHAEAGCDFLLAGFGKRKRMAHILSIFDNAYGDSHDRQGYGAVGSGDVIAQSVLNGLPYSREFSEAKALYALSAAKFAAEGELVGPGTRISVFRRDGSIWTTDWQKVRALWEVSRDQIPENAEAVMPSLKCITKPQRVRKRSAKKRVQKSPKHDRKGRPPSRG